MTSTRPKRDRLAVHSQYVAIMQLHKAYSGKVLRSNPKSDDPVKKLQIGCTAKFSLKTVVGDLFLEGILGDLKSHLTSK